MSGQVMVATYNMVVSYINKRGDTVLLPTLSISGSIPVDTLPGYCCLGQTYAELPQLIEDH